MKSTPPISPTFWAVVILALLVVLALVYLMVGLV